MRRINSTERRNRLAVAHHLAPGHRAADPAAVARDLVALHSTDPASVYLGGWNRMADGSLADVENALYGERTLIRMLGMRRTVFVSSLDAVPVIQAACSRAVAATERAKLLKMLAANGITGDLERWLSDVEEVAMAALISRGEATAAELASDDPRLSQQIVLSRGKTYEGRQNVASRVLFLLAAQGRAVRGRPRGSWISHQYRWSPLNLWCPDGVADLPVPQARAELARRWLRANGPALDDDLRWYTGWTKTQTRQALEVLAPTEVDLDGRPGILLPDDVEPPAPVDPWAALLPGLDTTPMSWQHREWFMGEHSSRLFDGFGNVGPTVWWNGRVVGGWAQDSTGDVVWRFLEDVGADAEQAVEAAAGALNTVLRGVRLTPRTRGRTWLEEELAQTG